MDGITFGRTSLLCTLLLWSLQVGAGGQVTVAVTPKVEVMKGETASLPCTFAVSSPSGNTIVEWYISEGEGKATRKRVGYGSVAGERKIDDGTYLTGRATVGKDYSLVISPVLVEDNQAFICQVTVGPNGNGEARTDLHVFFAPEKPELTQATQSITVGSTVSSEVGTCISRNGFPQARIIWYKDGNPLPEVKDINEKTHVVPSVVKEASGLFTISSMLNMQPTKEDKDSLFHCSVEYAMPSDTIKHKDSNQISIALNYPSETATFTLVNTEPVKEGDDVTMKCMTDGNPQPEFEFTKDGVAIKVDNDIGLVTLKAVKRTDAGLYHCKGTDYDNYDANLSGEIQLSVHFIDPLSVTPAGPLSAMLGEQVEMQCKAKSSAPLLLQWKKGDEVLSQNGVLSLASVTFAEAGEYQCVATVPTVPGLTAEASVTLEVKGKPMADDAVDGSVEKEGDMVTLSCSAHGNPPPQFTWTPSGKESVAVEGNKVTSTVTLEATEAVMKDGVTCQVSNTLGTDTKVFMVHTAAAAAPGTNANTNANTNPNNDADRADKQQGGSSGVVVAVVVCVLLLLLLVALLYFLNKKGKLPCSKKDKKDVAGGEVNNDIVVEMKTEKANEEAGLLNKRPAPEQ